MLLDCVYILACIFVYLLFPFIRMLVCLGFLLSSHITYQIVCITVLICFVSSLLFDFLGDLMPTPFSALLATDIFYLVFIVCELAVQSLAVSGLFLYCVLAFMSFSE